MNWRRTCASHKSDTAAENNGRNGNCEKKDRDRRCTFYYLLSKAKIPRERRLRPYEHLAFSSKPFSVAAEDTSKTEAHIISCLIINARRPIITHRGGSGYAKQLEIANWFQTMTSPLRSYYEYNMLGSGGLVSMRSRLYRSFDMPHEDCARFSRSLNFLLFYLHLLSVSFFD